MNKKCEYKLCLKICFPDGSFTVNVTLLSSIRAWALAYFNRKPSRSCRIVTLLPTCTQSLCATGGGQNQSAQLILFPLVNLTRGWFKSFCVYFIVSLAFKCIFRKSQKWILNLTESSSWLKGYFDQWRKFLFCVFFLTCLMN